MSASKTSTYNKEFIKLANQIEKLTKIVDNLQEEVKAMKRNKSYRNENQHREINKGKTLTKSEIIENKAKTNPFERLKFFRKNDKTSENSDTRVDSDKKKDKDTSKDKARNDQQLGTIKKNDTTDLRSTPKKKRSHLTQLNSDDDEINKKQSGLVCSVKDCSVQTNNNNQELLTQRKIVKPKEGKSSEQLDKKVESKSKSKLKSSCDDCAKSSKSKSPQCSKDCPYLNKKQVIDNGTNMEQNNESKFKEDKIESDVQTSKNQDYTSDKEHNIKKFKNKKIMVNLIRSGNEESLKTFKNDENLQINCRFIEDVDLSDIRNLKRKGMDTSNASVRVAQRSIEKKNGCKQCSQNCGPKTILKINKAILAPDPPMIFLSSKESRKGESGHSKKSLIKNCEQFLKRRKSKQCHSDYEPRTCCSPHHDEFSETIFHE